MAQYWVALLGRTTGSQYWVAKVSPKQRSTCPCDCDWLRWLRSQVVRPENELLGWPS
jgi:hypothetical protein